MEENTQLPKEVVNGVYKILLNHSHANRTAAAEEIAHYVVEEYATKLHQLQQENDKLKAMAEGWRPLLESILKDTQDVSISQRLKKFLYGE